MSRLKLWPFQLEAVTSVETAWAGGMRRPAFVMPTGTGKTVTFSEVAERHHAATGQRVLFLAHRTELVRQAASTLTALTGRRAGIVKGTLDQTGAPFVVASMMSLATAARRARIRNVGLVIVDEAHHALAPTYLDILEHYGVLDGPKYGRSDGRRALGLGVTATMSRGDGGALGRVWDDVVYEYSLVQAIRDGFLVEPRGIRVDVDGLNLDAVKRAGRDFQDEALGEALSDSLAPELIVRAWREHANGRPTVLFGPTVKFAQIMVDAFRAAGVSADIVHGGQTDAERAAVWARVDSGQTMVVCNCMVATEGTDVPRWACVIIARLTGHPTLYLQMVGRGLRLHPGKTDCVVLDVVGVSTRHRLIVLPDLVGLEDEAAKVDSDAPAEDAELVEDVEPAEVVPPIPVRYRDGVPIYEEVDLFHGSRLTWLRTDGGVWFLPVGNRYIAVLPSLSRERDEWDVVGMGSWVGGEAWVIASAVPGLSLAQGFAEQDVTEDERAVASKLARFRTRDANVGAARLARVGLSRGATRGQLMEAETRVHASSRLDPVLAWLRAQGVGIS